MSISGILSSSNQCQIGGANSLQQNFQQLGQALQSGNLSSAQSDFATLQAAFSQPATTSGNATSSTSATANPLNQAFSQLASDLQAGNLSAAQKDYSTVQQTLHSAHGTISRGRFNPQNQAGGGVSGGQNALLQELSQISQNPSTASSTLASAQQGYATVQQELQQFALSGTASLTSESPISFDV
jgi:hypothetical protein